MRRYKLLQLILALIIVAPFLSRADGVFVFRWNKQGDINEPTQKAILFFDKGREDMVLQVKYEGPAEEFGWLVPVPGLPEVRKGSMECFYELSKLTQKKAYTLGEMAAPSHGRGIPDDSINVIKIETVGAYEVTILGAGDAGKLREWLDANGFSFPKDKTDVLEGYVKKHWYFIAARINPVLNGFASLGSKIIPLGKKTISLSTRKQLANGELHPLVISFDTEKCVYPLAISAVNGKPSEISLYVLAGEPLVSRMILDKKFAGYLVEREKWIKEGPERRKAWEQRFNRSDEMIKKYATNRPLSLRLGEDPADRRPSTRQMDELLGRGPRMNPENIEYSIREPLATGMEAGPENLKACAAELPRLAGKTWWLTKTVETLNPPEMQDIEFEAAVPLLSEKLSTQACGAAVSSIGQFGKLAIPTLLAAAQSGDAQERRAVTEALAEMRDPNLVPMIPLLLKSEDVQVRRSACFIAADNWQESFAPLLVGMLRDNDAETRHNAAFVLRRRVTETQYPVIKEIFDKDEPGAGEAVNFLNVGFSRTELIRMLASTNLPVVSWSFTTLRHTLTLEELDPLLKNPLPMARMMALGELGRIRDKTAIDRMVAMLHDPNELVRWSVRSRLRILTGQKLGADPAAYEKWWKENRETFVPSPVEDPRPRLSPDFDGGGF